MAPPSIPEQPETPSLSDRDLVTRLRNGQMDALGALYDRYGGLVYTLALRMLTSREAAEDLTQDVFMALSQGQQYDPDRGSLGSYLATYTRSRALDRLRVNSNRLRILRQFRQMLTPSSKSQTPAEQVVQQERSHRIRAALQEIPDAERTVLEIAYFEGCSQSQIANRLNMPLGTVKTRSRQGLRRLRTLLEADDI
ncbi:sigma-70 family RNA polymerase sigma factor [Leptolyngbya sp. PCC 6406]|uniref:sigma-70 family RNA polymerase sigma factor n=1 Tax=Leptolyngbya sp. PCC 6406 TaxID=1173264 RepID=UPI0002ABED64|nr:sigma-70 family RNA polymerase sigma factor [Leptolyngbya sp. PCC 6406]